MDSAADAGSRYFLLPSSSVPARDGDEAVCVFGDCDGEGDDGKSLLVPCAAHSDGTLQCERPLVDRVRHLVTPKREETENPPTSMTETSRDIEFQEIRVDKEEEGGEEGEANSSARRQIGSEGMNIRIRVGGGLEAKVFYEFTREELEELRLKKGSSSSPAPSHFPCPLPPPPFPSSLAFQCLAEMIGTCLMTWIIIGSVSSAAIAKAQSSIWEVGIVCGLGVSIGIFCTASISGAHLNPAMSLAFAIVRSKEFDWKKLIPYATSQLLGAWVAGLLNYLFWRRVISNFAEVIDPSISRGQPGSIQTALCFGEYTPNPSFPYWTPPPGQPSVISPPEGLLVEVWGTFVLSFVVFAVTHPKNRMVTSREWVPLVIGLTVAVLISLLGPLTQAGFNPARDFGPRLVAYMFGWGEVAIPGPQNIFWIYIVGPLIGAPLGGILHDWILAKSYEYTTRVEDAAE
jgi:glycerol uptake facilitator protein